MRAPSQDGAFFAYGQPPAWASPHAAYHIIWRYQPRSRLKGKPMRYAQTVATLLLLVSGMLLLAGCAGSSGVAVETDGERSAFKQTMLQATANTAFTVTFKNSSSSQQHNWVLVKGGDDMAQQVATEAIAANTNFVPDDANVVAHSDLLAGGSSAMVQVPALPAGTYIFLC